MIFIGGDLKYSPESNFTVSAQAPILFGEFTGSNELGNSNTCYDVSGFMKS